MQYSIVCLIVGAQWMVCSVLVFVDLVPEPSAALPESGNNLREDIIRVLETIMLSCIAREKLMFCKDLLISRKVQTSHIQRQFIIVNYIDLNKHFCLASNHMLQQNMSILYS